MNYHQDYEYLSKSFLAQFAVSPLHAYNYMHAEKKDTPAMLFGRIYHAAIAGEPYFVLDEASRPEPDRTMATNANKAWKAEAIASATAKGLEVIGSEEHAEIEAMLQQLSKNATVKAVNAFSLLQEEVFKAKVGGRKLKCKPDGLQLHRGKNKENLIIDWKTCNDITPYAVTKAVNAYAYDVQAALYCDVISELHGGESNMLFIFQEKSAPYDVLPVLVSATSETMQAGRRKYEGYYDTAMECFETGIWPGVASNYVNNVLILE